MAGDNEFNLRMAFACGLDGGRQFHLDVAGGVEDERDQYHALRAARRAIEPFADQHIGMFDETDVDAPVRMHRAPLGSELLDLVVAVPVAGTVAGKQQRRLDGFSH